jgi:hypothetical protein
MHEHIMWARGRLTLSVSLDVFLLGHTKATGILKAGTQHDHFDQKVSHEKRFRKSAPAVVASGAIQVTGNVDGRDCCLLHASWNLDICHMQAGILATRFILLDNV